MRIISSIIIAVLTTMSVSAQKKADLIYNLESNKVYRVKAISNQNTTQTIMGNEQVIQTGNTAVISIKPLKQSEGEMIAEVRFDTMITIMSQPPMEINSANPGDLNSSDPAKVMECIMNRMSNSTFLVRMTNTGRVLQFMNLEPNAASILQGIDSLQGQTAMFVSQQAATMVEEKSLKSTIETITVYLPGTQVKVGEKWEISLPISGGGMDMTQEGIYKLERLENTTATISGDLVIESAPTVMEMNGAQITPDLRGLGKIELTIDAGTGWIISGTARKTMKGEMSVNAQGTTMTIPMEIITDSEILAIP